MNSRACSSRGEQGPSCVVDENWNSLTYLVFQRAWFLRWIGKDGTIRGVYMYIKIRQGDL